MKVLATTIAKEFVCPITQELPIKPVTGEDGKIYEEAAIREWFARNNGEAAGLGSDFGARFLGEAFFKGTSGLPKDPARARYWLKKVVDGECAHKHLSNEARADAAVLLHELDGGDEALYARLQRRHEEHQRRQREATALRE